MAQKFDCQIDMMDIWVFKCHAYLYVRIVMS